MLSLPPITLRLRGWKLIDRVALAFLLLCSISLGAACGLLFVYARLEATRLQLANLGAALSARN